MLKPVLKDNVTLVLLTIVVTILLVHKWKEKYGLERAFHKPINMQ